MCLFDVEFAAIASQQQFPLIRSTKRAIAYSTDEHSATVSASSHVFPSSDRGRKIQSHAVSWRSTSAKFLLSLMHPFALLLCFSALVSASFKTICSKTPYGQLELTQCIGLERTFANIDDAALRIFDEEQLAEWAGHSWVGIRNPFKTSVVQVPRIWSECMFNNLSLIEQFCPCYAF